MLSISHIGSKLLSLIEEVGLLEETTLNTKRGSSLVIGQRDKPLKLFSINRV